MSKDPKVANTDPTPPPIIEKDDPFFPPPATEIMIGTEVCPVLPLNMFGLKAVLSAVKNSVQPLATGYNAFTTAQQAYKADPTLPAPDPMWFFSILIDDIDNIFMAILVVLKRGNARLSIPYLEENVDVFVHLPLLWAAFSRVNNLGELAKK